MNFQDMYVYEDGELEGERYVDVDEEAHIDSVMLEFFGSSDWKREDNEDEIWIGISDCEYMVNKKF